MKSLLLALFLVFALAPAGCLAAQEQSKVLIEWKFDKDGDLKGWQPNNHLRNVRAADGVLAGEVSDWDPFLTSPVFEVRATPWQWIELEMKCDKADRGDIFWSNTMVSPYEGFFPEKHTPFDIPGDDQWQTVRIFPYWHGEKKIIHFRIDLCKEQKFALRAIRVCEPAGQAQGLKTQAWDFAQGAQGWTAVAGLSTPAKSAGGITVRVEKSGGTLTAPMLAVPIEDQLWVAVRMRVGGIRPPNPPEIGGAAGVRPPTPPEIGGAGGANTAPIARASLVWVTENTTGLQSMEFPVRADGLFHTYNVDVGADRSWAGSLISLALRPSHTPGSEVEIASIRLEKDAVGGPDLEMVYLGLDDAVNRAGKPCRLVAKFVNRGGQSAKGLKAQLTVPAGVTAVAEPVPAEFEFQIPAGFRYTLTAAQPVEGKVTLRLTGPGAPAEAFTAPIKITAGPKVAKAAYVPAPVPAKTDYLIGTYYFPGWNTGSKWECIDRVAPIRKPILGYYDEAKPECADWQIKWAVEHGINLFLVDWYWSGGGRHLEHWLHDGYMKSRYRKHLKWAIMWANHNAPNTHSEADWKNVTQYWIDNYFGMPEYQRIDGKPVVYIWAPGNIRRDLGGSAGAAKLLAMSQEMAKGAGYKGIVFASMNASGSTEDAKRLVAEGYTLDTTYHWWADAPKVAPDGRNFPYSLVVDRSRAAWEKREANFKDTGMTFLPVADSGWDSRPWHGDKSMVIYDRTPAQWERLLREAKSYLDARGQKTLILGPCNEWGEGSYIEPCAEYGFEMYDAVRRVFCKDEPHTDLAPVDVGLGAYDFPTLSAAALTAWDFNTAGDAGGWGGTMGMSEVKVRDGSLYGKTASKDPAFGSSTLNVRAAQYPYVVIRMKVGPQMTKGDSLQLFWATATQVVSEASSVRMEIIADGEFHTYVLPVGANPRWRGLVRNFRLDPGSQAGVELWIDEIRLAKEKPAAQ